MFLSRTSGVDGTRVAVCTFMNVRDSRGVVVVADNVLPGIALLAQNGTTIVFLVAAYALDHRRLFLFDRAV